MGNEHEQIPVHEMEMKVPEDDDSVESDSCWEELYRGHSRKWLMRDGKKYSGGVVSTMKETYPNPTREEQFKNVGRRRAILLQKFYDEAAAEIIRERDEPPPVEEYCTEYDGNYNIPGFEPEKDVHEKNTELYVKYPLHSSPAMSIWNFKLYKNPRGQVSLPGLTTITDLKNPFKRDSKFTKPISEVIDDCNM